jgi:hypothetical protein
MLQQSQVQSSADSIPVLSGPLEYNSDSYGGPQGGLLGRLLALQDERARDAADAYGGYDPEGSRVVSTAFTTSQN